MANAFRDAEFYKSGGGVTVSGGEPFMQSEFLTELAKSAKKRRHPYMCRNIKRRALKTCSLQKNTPSEHIPF